MSFLVANSYCQDYYKIKISSKKVKLFAKDNTKTVFEVDSIQIVPTGKVFYLSCAEKKVTMEFLKKEQVLRLTETFEGKPLFDSTDQIHLSAVAVNRTAFR